MSKLEVLFEELVRRGGTHLHVAPGRPPCARVDGDIVPMREAVLDARRVEELLGESLDGERRSRLDAEKSLRFTGTVGASVRFRASYFATTAGLSAVFRLLPAQPPSLAELGCPEVVWRLADRPRGLLLVAGPTASGKTTTVSAIVDHVNKTRAAHIVTVEDSVELVHEPLRAQITQHEVGADTPTVAAGLAAAVREDADVVVVGNLADADAIRAALDLASRGILVIASVAARGTASAIEEVARAFVPSERGRIRAILAGVLVGVVAQQLVAAADGSRSFAVYEALVATPAVVGIVRETALGELAGAVSAVLSDGEAIGMVAMDAALERLLAARRITAEAAVESAVDKESFTRVAARLFPELSDTLLDS